MLTAKDAMKIALREEVSNRKTLNSSIHHTILEETKKGRYEALYTTGDWDKQDLAWLRKLGYNYEIIDKNLLYINWNGNKVSKFIEEYDEEIIYYGAFCGLLWAIGSLLFLPNPGILSTTAPLLGVAIFGILRS